MTSNTFLTKGAHTRYVQARSTGNVTIGSLIELTAGEPYTYKLQTTAKADADLVFCNIVYQNNDILGTIVATGQTIEAVYPVRGSTANVAIAPNAGAIVIGDQLESAGSGNMRKFTDGVVLGTAIEPLDNSSVTTVGRVKAILR